MAIDTTGMSIVAKHADIDTLWIVSAPQIKIDIGYSVDAGRVLDTEAKQLFQPMPLVSLSARDPWIEYTGDQSILPSLLVDVQEV